ncbi:MAG: FtsX-like permease family protein, partial [Ignavibacteriaceae bacterium]
IVGIIFLVGVIAGGYPAIYLSSLQPVDSIKGEIKYRDKKISTRNVLLVSQFAISIALIISTIFISKQLSFVSKKNLGFDKSNILVLPLLNSESKENLAELRNSLTSISGVKYVSGSSDIPYNNFTSNGYIPEGFTTPVMIHVVDTDHNFLEAYGIKLSEGRSFISGMTSDSSAYLINEALAKQLGWDNPIGKTITRNGKHKIIGIVKNFNYSSLHSQIEPLIITEKPYSNLFSFVSVKISPDNISGTLAQIKKSWDKSNHTSVFEYSFLSDEINQLYKPENNFRQIFLTFASVAIILALFGLFSLASLSTEQKTKEIGIRKVLGDTSAGITIRLLKEYFVFVIIANIIAWPLAYYFINSWLNNFVYRININWLLFMATGVITLLVAMGTVIWQAIRAASADPVKSIRYE